MSQAMRRARAQYFWRNVRGMIGAAAFGASVYWYSIKAVSQDDFVSPESIFHILTKLVSSQGWHLPREAS